MSSLFCRGAAFPNIAVVSFYLAAGMITSIASGGTGGMVYDGKVILNSPARSLYGAAFDPTTGFGYFGTAASASVNPGHLTKVDLNSALPAELVDSSATPVPLNTTNLNSGFVDTRSPNLLNHNLYFGASNSIVKFSPGDATHGPSYAASIPLNSGEVCAASMIDVSGANHYGYFTITGSTPRMVKVDLDAFQIVGSANFFAGQNAPRRSVIDAARGWAYSVSGAPNSSYLAKFNLDLARGPFAEVGSADLSADIDPTVGGGFGSAVIDLEHDYAYVGTYQVKSSAPNTPSVAQARVVKIDLNGETSAAPTRIESLTLASGHRELSTAVFDPDGPGGGAIYFGDDHTYPARIYQVIVGDGSSPMFEDGVLSLPGGPRNASSVDGTNLIANPDDDGLVFTQSSLIDRRDPLHHYAYFGTDTNAGQVAKIEIPVPFLAGDYNDDGFVDAGDYVMWRKNVGQPAGTLPNDNTEVAIGDDQYNLWRSNFGSPPGSGSALGSTTVPEPNSGLAAVVWSAIALIQTWRRKGQLTYIGNVCRRGKRSRMARS
jgi:hypothetical protein